LARKSIEAKELAVDDDGAGMHKISGMHKDKDSDPK